MAKIDHSSAGALYAHQQQTQIGKILAYLIAGHHAGLPDWEHEAGIGGALSGRLSSDENLYKALKGNPPQNILEVSLPTSKPLFTSIDAVHVWVRMLYSCLVDADYLDTESFMDPPKSDLRGNTYTLQGLKVSFDSFMDDKQKEAQSTPVNHARKIILEDCINQAELTPGIFSLTVPTGGGKTLASMAFALNHAIKHGKKRIIVAIPYTSIIEQTADVYRQVFGNDAVLEHHSNFDSEKENSKANLAIDNWDAPIIVTTNVQLFESLFAARSSACRKLHNIVNSVIVLDEAQMLPPEYLQPIVSVLKVLTEYFKTSVVLCTATQPVLSGRIGSGQNILKGFNDGSVRELMSDTDKLFQVFQRVTLQLFGDLHERQKWSDVAERLCDYGQALCIVNTRNDCRELHALMPEGTVHLSALMCPEHRGAVITSIKSKLKENIPVHVISTQLLEAGVDIDFPVVFRAFTGLDSIAQAAGRCNREGKLKKGQVFVFNPPKPPPAGILLKAEQAGHEMFRFFPENATSLMPDAFKLYFHLYFNRLNDFDKKHIMELLAGPDVQNFNIQFRTAASRFKLIDDARQHGLIVRYSSGTIDNNTLINQLRFAGPSRKLMRKLQRFSVNVYDRDLQEMRNNGMIEEVSGIWVQTSENLYDSKFGLNVRATPNLYW